MTLNSSAIVDAIASHASSLGIFDRVNTHEPKNAPGNGLTCMIFLASGGPARGESGLAATSALLTFTVRLHLPMLQEPQDDIDKTILTGLDTLVTAYSGDLDLGSTVRYIDVLGSAGQGLNWKTGQITYDQIMYRTYEIELPLIVDDVWNQVM